VGALGRDDELLEDPIGDARHQQDESVQGRRGAGEMVLTHPGGGERNQGQPEEQVEVGPEDRARHLAGGVQHVMVVVPVYSDVHVAQHVHQKNRDDGFEGVEALSGAEHTIIPDRIETGTFIVAAAITGGELEIKGCRPDHIGAVIEKLRETGVEIDELNPSTLLVRRSKAGLSAKDVTTEPHPHFPTDMQAQYMALMTQADGVSTIIETIFENRFMHASELVRMGADIHISGNTAVVRGKTSLTGARVIASDLRASASLVLAGLCASGETLIDRVYHIDRGYETIVRKLRDAGADIERLTEGVVSAAAGDE